MKALVYTGTQTLEYRDEPPPEPAAGESLVRIEASGICGSDMHAWHGHDPRRVPPLILGHELAGIAESGPLRGRPVVINPLITCGHCAVCRAGMPNLCATRDLLGLGRPGGYAQAVVAPDSNIFERPATLDAVQASLMEPTAVSLHAIHLAEKNLHRPVSESRALIIGGGAIGVLAALLLVQKGARDIHIAETSACRREHLQSLDGISVYDPLSSNTPPDACFELVIDAVGSGATRREASNRVCAGGVISHIGLQDSREGLDTRRLTLQEITFIGNYTYNQADLHAALTLLADGALGDLQWVETRPLSGGAEAFLDIHHARATAAKIVLLPET